MTTATMDIPRILGFVADMYLMPPGPDRLRQWRTALAGAGDPVLEPVKQALAAIDSSDSVAVERLQTEYARLFVGPSALPCPPWESMYTSPGRQMMQEAHDAVQDLYAGAGVSLADSAVLPDHIGAELGFLALLIDRAAASDAAERERLLQIADRLLDDHLNTWTTQFTLDVEQATGSELYRALARSTRLLLVRIQE